jgi:hypothetical protein
VLELARQWSSARPPSRVSCSRLCQHWLPRLASRFYPCGTPRKIRRRRSPVGKRPLTVDLLVYKPVDRLHSHGAGNENTGVCTPSHSKKQFFKRERERENQIDLVVKKKLQATENMYSVRSFTFHRLDGSPIHRCTSFIGFTANSVDLCPAHKNVIMCPQR